MKKKVIRILSLLLCSMLLLQDISPVCAYAVEDMAGMENLSDEAEKPPDAGENARAKTYNNVYYTTKKTIVLKDAYNSKFYIRVLKDYENVNWPLFTSGNGGYIPKGTDIQISKTKWHKVHSDVLTITRSGDDQIITMDCDTFKVTPYLQVEKYARPGYTLKGTPKITEDNNKNTTKSSNGSTITTHVSTHEIIRKDGYMDIYLGALSDVSEIKFDWEANNYKVHYDANGGTGTMSDSNHVYDESKNLNKNKYTRPGYEFIGWKDSKGNSYDDMEKVKNLTTKADDIVTLYAQWEPVSVKVVFHKNDGSDTTYTETYTYGKSGNKFGMGLSKTGSGIGTNSFGNWTPLKGKELLGWSTSSTATAKEYATDSSVTNSWINTNSGKTIHLYAVWDPNKYTVSYNGNSHTSGSTNPTTHYYGKPSPLALNGFVKEGYHFDTWTEKANDNTTEYQEGKDVLNLTDVDGKNITLFAGWLPNKLTINYHANGGTITDTSKGYTMKDGYLMAKDDASKKAYKDVYYNSTDNPVNVHNINGTFGVTKKGYHPKAGAEYRINNKDTGQEIDHNSEPLSTFQSYIKTKNNTITLYANWEPNTYTVKYDLNGGSGTVSPSKHTYGTAKALNTYSGTKKGYTFTGWLREDTGETFSNGQSVKNLTDVHDDTVTLVAQWRPNVLTINYHANGGTITDTSKGYPLKDGYLMLKDGTKKAYKELKYNSTDTTVNVSNIGGTFGIGKTGWHLEDGIEYRINSTSGEEIDHDAESIETFRKYMENGDATITLYANWKKNTYTVEYDLNGGSGTMSPSTHTYGVAKALNKCKGSKTGYVFTGWKRKDTGATFSDGQSVKNLTDVHNGIVTLVAQWEKYVDPQKPNKLTIYYNANGGEISDTSKGYPLEDNGDLLLKPETGTGKAYKKISYNDTEDPVNVHNMHGTFGVSKKGYHSKPGAEYRINNKDTGKEIDFNSEPLSTFQPYFEDGDNSITLYANWEANKYTVVYNGNGHTSGSMEPSEHTYDAQKNLTANGFKREGYTFIGWAKSATGDVVYKNKAEVENLTATDDGTVTLYAKWRENKLTIHYNANGGTITDTSHGHPMSDDGYILLEDGSAKEDMVITYQDKDDPVNVHNINGSFGVTKTGYHSKSDAEYRINNKDTGKEIDHNAEPLSTFQSYFRNGDSSITLYANWEANQYTVVYNGNGHTGGSTASSKHTYDESKNLTSNGYIKTGYTFTGWNTKADGSGTSYANKASVKNLTAAKDGTVTLYAQWTKNTYSVTYDGNGSTSGSTAASSHTYDTAKALTANGFVKSGYTFAGWNTAADGSGTSYSNKASVKNLTAANKGTVVLFAQWKANTYTVSYNGNGSTSGSTASSSHTYDTAKALTANGFTKTGYTFSGWNTKADGTGIRYANKASVKNLTATSKGSVTLFAQWTANTYTVSYDGNGSTSGSTASSSHTYDTAKALTANGFEREGYKFSGWNTKKDGSGTSYADLASVKNLTATDKGGVTLFAQWSANSYTITFDGNGATSGSMTDMTCFYDTSYTLPENAFLRTGYTFIVWEAVTSDGVAEFYDMQTIKNLSAEDGATITLHARWEGYRMETVFYRNTSEDDTEYTTEEFFYDRTLQMFPQANAFWEMTGFHIIGWAEEKDAVAADYDYMYEVDNSYIETHYPTHVLYAVWKENTYTVKYDGNGHTSGLTVESCHTYNREQKLTENGYSRTGYTFNGWNTAADGSGTSYSDMENVLNMTTKNEEVITLYAQWVPNRYTVTYNGNGSTSGETASSSHTYDTAKALTENGYGKVGHNFIGWNTEADGSGTSYEDKEAVLNLTAEANATITLYAQWEAQKTTVHFYRNDTETDAEYLTQNFIYGVSGNQFGYNTDGTPAWPHTGQFGQWDKTGYTLLGWATEKSAENAEQSVFYTAEDAWLAMVYPAINLYGVWVKNTYTIAYHGNGATNGEMESSLHTYDEEKTLTANGFVRDGYSFAGWNTAADGSGTSFRDMEAVLNLTAEANATITLYAQWDKHPEINAKDRYFSLEEAKNGVITQEELLATVTAEDLEDGVLANGTDVWVKDFDPLVFTSLTGNAKIEITYEAKDSFGTVVSTTVTVSVVVIETTESPTENYVRFISEDFYADEEGNLLSPEEGGLEETSIWRRDESYRNVLSDVLHAEKINVETKTVKAFGQEWEVEVEGSGEWVDAEETWILKKEDLNEMKEYTSEHGHVLNALDEFFALFGNCKQ